MPGSFFVCKITLDIYEYGCYVNDVSKGVLPSVGKNTPGYRLTPGTPTKNKITDAHFLPPHNILDLLINSLDGSESPLIGSPVRFRQKAFPYRRKCGQ